MRKAMKLFYLGLKRKKHRVSEVSTWQGGRDAAEVTQINSPARTTPTSVVECFADRDGSAKLSVLISFIVRCEVTTVATQHSYGLHIGCGSTPRASEG